MQAKWMVGLGLLLTFSFISSQSEGVTFDEIQRLSRLSVVDYTYDFFGDAEIEYILEEAESRPPDGYVEPVDLSLLIDEYEAPREQFVAVPIAPPSNQTPLPPAEGNNRVTPSSVNHRVLTPAPAPTVVESNRNDFVAQHPVPSGGGVMRTEPSHPSHGQSFRAVTPPVATSAPVVTAPNRNDFVAQQPVPPGDGVMRTEPSHPSHGQSFRAVSPVEPASAPVAVAPNRADFVAQHPVPPGDGVVRTEPSHPSHGQAFRAASPVEPASAPVAVAPNRADFAAQHPVPPSDGVRRTEPSQPSHGQAFREPTPPPVAPVIVPAPVTVIEEAEAVPPAPVVVPAPVVPPAPVAVAPREARSNPWQHLPLADQEFFEPHWNNELDPTRSYIQVMATHQPLSLRATMHRLQGVVPLQIVVSEGRLGLMYRLVVGPLQADELGVVAALLERQGIRDYFLIVQ